MAGTYATTVRSTSATPATRDGTSRDTERPAGGLGRPPLRPADTPCPYRPGPCTRNARRRGRSRRAAEHRERLLRGGIARVEPERFAELHPGLLHAALGPEHDAELPVGPRVVGLQPDRRGVVLDRRRG